MKRMSGILREDVRDVAMQAAKVAVQIRRRYSPLQAELFENLGMFRQQRATVVERPDQLQNQWQIGDVVHEGFGIGAGVGVGRGISIGNPEPQVEEVEVPAALRLEKSEEIRCARRRSGRRKRRRRDAKKVRPKGRRRHLASLRWKQRSVNAWLCTLRLCFAVSTGGRRFAQPAGGVAGEPARDLPNVLVGAVIYSCRRAAP